MSIFFPGNFFPLATLSSIADHMFSSLLPCFSLLLISEVRDPLILTLRFIQVVVDQIASYTICLIDGSKLASMEIVDFHEIHPVEH
jgi:hypothetical protein